MRGTGAIEPLPVAVLFLEKRPGFTPSEAAGISECAELLFLLRALHFCRCAAAKAQSLNVVRRGSEKPSFDCAQARQRQPGPLAGTENWRLLDGELRGFPKRKLQLPVADQPKFVADELAWIRDRNQHCGLVGTIDATIEELAASKPCMVIAIIERIVSLGGGIDSATGQAFLNYWYPETPAAGAPAGAGGPSTAPGTPPGNAAGSAEDDEAKNLLNMDEIIQQSRDAFRKAKNPKEIEGIKMWCKAGLASLSFPERERLMV